ncbi:hypothetical protein D3C85_1792930 [compost metagenome]
MQVIDLRSGQIVGAAVRLAVLAAVLPTVGVEAHDVPLVQDPGCAVLDRVVGPFHVA